MRNTGIYIKIGILMFSLLLVAVVWIITITRANRNISNPNPIIHFALENNFLILVMLVLLSIAYGFLWSTISYRELEKKKQVSKGMLSTVFMFLGSEERNIVEFLVNNKGAATQADISRLPGMTRVKAFRSLHKMQGKNILEIVPHGKVRNVKLKENIMSALLE